MPRLPGVPSNVTIQTGPILLGNVIGYALYGILIVQIFLYHHRFLNDPLWMKMLGNFNLGIESVRVLFFLDTIITMLSTVAAWNTLASGWGNPDTLTPLDWPYWSMPLFSALVASCVHIFFCWRIWKLKNWRVIPACIATVSLLACTMAGYCGIQGRILGMLKLGTLKPYVSIWLGGSALADVMITSCMVFVFFQVKAKTSFQGTVSIVQKLMTLTIETAMATTLAALMELILFFIFPGNNMHFLPYSNTLLATLNARAFISDNIVQSTLWTEAPPTQNSHPIHVSMLQVRQIEQSGYRSTMDTEMDMLGVRRSPLFASFTSQETAGIRIRLDGIEGSSFSP
ncbi:hypothetical protein L208DRAFT_1374797 [Tricholoma matsutake]|nr:hypothetical protein L208DRAFT_1374797 [Tricholoma matsutake 945]